MQYIVVKKCKKSSFFNENRHFLLVFREKRAKNQNLSRNSEGVQPLDSRKRRLKWLRVLNPQEEKFAAANGELTSLGEKDHHIINKVRAHELLRRFATDGLVADRQALRDPITMRLFQTHTQNRVQINEKNRHVQIYLQKTQKSAISDAFSTFDS